MNSAASYPCREGGGLLPRVSELPNTSNLCLPRASWLLFPSVWEHDLLLVALAPSVVSHHPDRAASAFLVLLPWFR